MSKSDFKKKYSYKYKLLSKFNLIDEVFLNYKEDFFKIKKLQDYMTQDEIISFCKTKKKSEISNKIRRLLKIYNINLSEIEFIERKKQCKYSDEYLKNVISQYVFEIELMINDYDIYRFCKNKNILKGFKLIKNNISLPQLICKYILDLLLKEKGELNNREIIKPKEVDVFYKKYDLCIEYDGLYWHKNRKKEDVEKEEKILKKGYNFIKIVESNKDYENDIKNQLIQNLNLLNKITNLNITKDEITNIKIDMCKIFDLDIIKLREKLSFYKTKEDFVKSENIFFLQICKLGMKNVINDYYKKIEIDYLKDIKSYDVLKKFNNITELKNKNNKLYKYILTEKKEILEELKMCRLKHFNSIKKYDSLYDMRHNNTLYQIALRYKRKNIIPTKYYSFKNIDSFVESKSYLELTRNKTFFKFLKDDGNLEYLIKKFKEKDFNKYFALNINLDEIKKIALNYSDINSFSKDYPKIIKYIRNNNLISVIFEHVSTLKFKNNIVKKDKYVIRLF